MLPEIIQYVIGAPYFWFGIGMTIASGMFVGATIYNGELNLLRKGLWTIGFYSLFLLIINGSRVINTLSRAGGTARPDMAWAGVNTIIVTTVAYTIGMVLGVYITKIAHKK